MMVVKVMQSVVAKRIEGGAEGGSRTRTSFRTTDFKSVASAIPPPRHIVRKPNSIKPFLFSLSHQNRDAYVDEPKMSHHSDQLDKFLNSNFQSLGLGARRS